MTIQFDRQALQSLGDFTSREWIETNGLGGWASSTIAGMNTRRYHGLLVAATTPPVGRSVLISKLEETIVTDNGRIELGCNQYPNLIHPEGYKFITSFEREFFPTWTYEIGQITLRKSVIALHHRNVTLVSYEMIKGPGEIKLEVAPFIAARDYHQLTHANSAIRPNAEFADDLFHVVPYEGVPEIFVFSEHAKFQSHPTWYYHFQYAIEQERGLDFEEDLYCYGNLSVALSSGKRAIFVLSTEDPRSNNDLQKPAKLIDEELNRRRRLLQQTLAPDAFSKELTLAADQFIVRRGRESTTIIAGYPWFTDWGRDTMIALPGLCLVTNRHSEARDILRTFAAHVSEGMVPNRFPDSGHAAEYNTVDASLWMFIAAYKYFLYSKDSTFIRQEMLEPLQEIVRWHEQGTRYNIYLDEDGLVCAGTPGLQLTWMDAKVGDWVVTPRNGQPVEVNALWYNALAILAEFHRLAGHDGDEQEFARKARRIRESFNQLFWNDAGGYLFDYVNGDYVDAAIRPNQLLAISLPHSLLSDQRARNVLRIVEEKLLTPVGLRSLDPAHSQYKGVYSGDQRSRDGAYHQGTVWTWLLGPYITAAVRYDPDGRKKAIAICNRLQSHLREAGIGTISEIFDGDSPHQPRGCFAQAWSVAEVLRAYVEDICGITPAGLTAPAVQSYASEPVH